MSRKSRIEELERRVDKLEAEVEYLGDQAGADIMARHVEETPLEPRPKRARMRVSHR